MITILVTGGAGFIGSQFVMHMLDCRDDVFVVNLDALTYAGNLDNLASVTGHKRYAFVRADIRDSAAVGRIFSQYDISRVINFAAESHVDRSIEDPTVFLQTNVIGTQTLLDAARRHWSICPDDKYCTAYKKGVRFLQVSTDEVYGALGPEGRFTENTPLQPNSPYAASKAGADLVVRAYWNTFCLPAVITRCSNNYGPFQFPEKLIPLMIINCLEDRPLPVYGDGLQIRDWLYVKDHCAAIEHVLRLGVDGEVYNIGGNNEMANIDIVRMIIKQLGKSERLIRHVKDRPGHDRRYAIDNTKITTRLGWQPNYSFDQALAETIRWYLDHPDWIRRITTGDYQIYYERMYPQ
jgi:dTDP-glucose 4,6-dehydratase